jgi:hypothetical protein
MEAIHSYLARVASDKYESNVKGAKGYPHIDKTLIYELLNGALLM